MSIKIYSKKNIQYNIQGSTRRKLSGTEIMNEDILDDIELLDLMFFDNKII